jgi:hypothetical protein
VMLETAGGRPKPSVAHSFCQEHFQTIQEQQGNH